MKRRSWPEVTSAMLHLLAMALMLCDHLWVTVVPGNNWMNSIGRIAFPIFSFMLVEGYFHTKNLKKYFLRLFIFAILSEIPFNLVVGSRILYPVHQNVLWTFLLSLLLIHWNEWAKAKEKLWLQILMGGTTLLCAYVLGIITFVDYHHYGILTVLAFYVFRGCKWYHCIGQVLALGYINLEMMGGLGYELSVFGKPFFFPQQGFALLALIPIWLYRGKQGHHSKAFQYFCYAFYPGHLLLLGLIKVLL